MDLDSLNDLASRPPSHAPRYETMGGKGIVLIGVVSIMTLYTLVFQNPLFLANPALTTSSDPNAVAVASYLPSAPSSPWLTTGLSYSCGGLGPGILEVTNPSQTIAAVVSISLTYDCATYTATGPNCAAGTGTTTVSIASLSVPSGASGDQYTGYVTLHDGRQVPFSGVWS